MTRIHPPTTTPPTIIDEVGSFITSLLSAPSTQLTACAGWTAHEMVAHLAAGAAEEAALIEGHLDGEQPRPTSGFEEREAPYRALPDEALRQQLFEQSMRLAAAMSRLGDESVMFTGRAMTAEAFAMHSRSECALHRWDLVGRDEAGWAMLAQPELLRHAVAILTSMRSLQEAPANRLVHTGSSEPVRVVLRSAPHDDLVIVLRDGSCDLSIAPVGDDPADVEMHPAQRLLVLWGRRDPSSAIQVVTPDGRMRHVLASLLAGH